MSTVFSSLPTTQSNTTSSYTPWVENGYWNQMMGNIMADAAGPMISFGAQRLGLGQPSSFSQTLGMGAGTSAATALFRAAGNELGWVFDNIGNIEANVNGFLNELTDWQTMPAYDAVSVY
jgi:hypothetical protein